MSRPGAIGRRVAAWLVLAVTVPVAVFNLWLAVNGSWPGGIAAAVLTVIAWTASRSLRRRRQS